MGGDTMSWTAIVWGALNDISTVVFVVAAGYAFYLWASGVLPVLYRLGNLRKRKIAVFAKGDAAKSLLDLFADARLFKDKNIISITSAADFGRADDATVFVVHWPDWENDLDNIVARKSDQTPLIVYAPKSGNPLPDEAMLLLDQNRNVVLANFRGRLLNDVVASFVTTAYEKR